MSKTLAQLQSQIASLQQQADELIAKDRTGVVNQVLEAIAHYGLTYQDLFGPQKSKPPTAKRSARKSARTPKAKGRVKFKDANGNTWSGMGKRPNWFKNALAAGQTPEDLLA